MLNLTSSLSLKTGRLYLLYCVTGLASLPFAIRYATLREAGFVSNLSFGILVAGAISFSMLVWVVLAKRLLPQFSSTGSFSDYRLRESLLLGGFVNSIDKRGSGNVLDGLFTPRLSAHGTAYLESNSACGAGSNSQLSGLSK